MENQPMDEADAQRLEALMDFNATILPQRAAELANECANRIDEIFKGLRDTDRPQYLHDFADAIQAFRTATEDTPDVGNADPI